MENYQESLIILMYLRKIQSVILDTVLSLVLFSVTMPPAMLNIKYI